MPYFPLLSYLINICPPFSPNLLCIENSLCTPSCTAWLWTSPSSSEPWDLGGFPQFGSKAEDTMLVALQTSWESALLYPSFSWQQQNPRSRMRLSKTSASSKIRQVSEELADRHMKTGTGTTLDTPQCGPPTTLPSPSSIRTSRAHLSLSWDALPLPPNSLSPSG